jgi:hypothetical protein
MPKPPAAVDPRQTELASLRARLAAAEKAREELWERIRRAEGLAAAVRDAAERLTGYLRGQLARQSGAGREGLETALACLHAHLGLVLEDEAARHAGAVIAAALLHPPRCRSAARPGTCRLCEAVRHFLELRPEAGRP